MFTGIIEEVGKIKAVERRGLSVRLSVWCGKVLDGIRIGDSIAVNGVCLTVSSFGEGWFCADVMPETVRRTNFLRLGVSDAVNLERALRLSDRLGGHIVTGHIDGTGVIADTTREDNAIWLTIKVSSDILKYVVVKGSVAVDGTSLTVAYVDGSCFKASLVPHTAGNTILVLKKPGDLVNIECDILGKYIEKLFGGNCKNTAVSGLTLDFLKDNGFA